VKESDFIGSATITLADGSEQSSDLFILHEVRVGDHVIRNVVANVAPITGDPLLGQSFLSKLPSWTIDNQGHALVFGDVSASSFMPQRPPPPMAPSIAPPDLAAIGNERSLQVVRAFYDALGRADGVGASNLVIPEKRLRGAFAPPEITKFYSGLPVPLRVLQMNASANDTVEVEYQYTSPNRRKSHGRAVVSLTPRGDLLLIEGIRAAERC
jgi:hypothetical protein